MRRFLSNYFDLLLFHLYRRKADCALTIDMLCNTDKTVCMIFPPKDKRKVVTSVFPCFKMNNLDLKYVDEFKYLGHIINERDDNDVSA